MSINKNDSPWDRLPWTLPAALAIGFTTLWIISYFVDRPTQRLQAPPSIEAQIVEIPAPPAPAPKKTSAPHKPSTPKRHVQPSIKKMLVQPNRPIKQVAPEHDAAPPAPPEPMTPTPTPTATTAPVTTVDNPSLTGNSGAQAISRPMPQIPDELRQDALNETAIARFHVAIDGRVTVELIKPTQNPRLNRLLLETLKHWRFFPAMKNGQPIASTQELSIKVNVQ